MPRDAYRLATMRLQGLPIRAGYARLSGPEMRKRL